MVQVQVQVQTPMAPMMLPSCSSVMPPGNKVVQNGVRTAVNKGTSVLTQGSGKNKIRVIVDNKTGDVITVTKG